MKSGTIDSVVVLGKQIAYRVVRSNKAKRLRIRVGPQGVEVIRPPGRTSEDVNSFIESNQSWVANQVERVKGLGGFRKPLRRSNHNVLFRGTLTPVRIEVHDGRRGANHVCYENGSIVIRTSKRSGTTQRSLENWFRKQARLEVCKCLDQVTQRLHRSANRVYIRGQRTKWGSCSSRGNLSFNWRLIMAPEFVLRYIVVHEAVHLIVPDHSQRFWLTVQSICPDAKRAKDWLAAHGHSLM